MKKSVVLLLCILVAAIAGEKEKKKKTFVKFDKLKNEELQRPKFAIAKTLINAVKTEDKGKSIILNSGTEEQRQNEVNPKDREGKQYMCNSGWNGGANQLFMGGGNQQFGGGYPGVGARPQYGGGIFSPLPSVAVGGTPQFGGGYPSGGGYGLQKPTVRYGNQNAWNSNPFLNFGNYGGLGTTGGGGGPVISGSPYPQIQIQHPYPGQLIAYGR